MSEFRIIVRVKPPSVSAVHVLRAHCVVRLKSVRYWAFPMFERDSVTA